jgi:radical SAM protein with 4Fe4S-binding SPASM domain
MSITEAFDFIVQWHLTERCNLQCKHCYQTGDPVTELTAEEVKAGLNELADTFAAWADNYDIAFMPSMNVTGGEPFLYDQLLHILEYIKKKGFDIYILSNGTLITKEKAKQISSIGVKGVQVSLEGPEDIHVKIRGDKSFTSALRGVGHLLDAGLEVTLNTTLSDLNADHLMDIKDLAVSLGVQRMGFSRLVPSGKGSTMLSNMLETDRVKDLYETAKKFKVKGLEIVTGDPVASNMFLDFDEEDEGSIPMSGCSAGVSGITILADGNFVPCRRLPVTLGNITTDSFREVWATSPALLKLRDRQSYKGKCRRCSKWASCRGCRAIAYAYSQAKGENDLLAEEPQCFLYS